MATKNSDNKINITQVAFRRKFNLGNYETEDIEFVATVADGQKAEDVLRALDKATVKYRDYQLSGGK
jgi:Tfp pilus assembly protein PilP